MEIRQIDVLVHPDFYQINTPNLPLHPRQKELRKKWEERINSLVRQEGAMLIYFSNIPRDRLNEALNGETNILNKIEREDIERIRRYREELGKRFVLFSKLELPSKHRLEEIFRERGLTYRPDQVKIYPYGEVFEACVTAWGYHTKRELNIPDANYNFYTEEMSLTFADTKKINAWRKRHEREIPRPSIA